METKQISELINTQIVPDLLGKETTIAVDLSNIIEVGKAIEDLEPEDITSFGNRFVVGVARTYFDMRRYKKSDLGLFIDSQEYGGIVQRVKTKLLDTQSDPIWTLESGQDYFDGTYYGVELSNKIYNQDESWLIANSIPVEQFKQAFTSREGVENLVSTIEITVQNTIDRNIHALSKMILCKLIVSTNGNREVHLVTMFNTLTGKELTTTNCLQDAEFCRWAAMSIVRLRDYVTEYNMKYNDGEIETFTPKEDTRVTLLEQFSTALKFNMESDTFNKELVSIGSFNTVNFWQNSSTALLPDLGVTAEVVESNGEEEPTKVENVVGIIYDRYSCGQTARLTKTTAQYISRGDYTTYFNHIAKRYFIDTRQSAITLCLD